jgi:hypothetical protein
MLLYSVFVTLYSYFTRNYVHLLHLQNDYQLRKQQVLSYIDRVLNMSVFLGCEFL